MKPTTEIRSVVHALRSRAGRLVRAWAPPATDDAPPIEVSPPPALPIELTESGSRRAMPLPPGWTAERVKSLLATVSIDGAPPTELANYLEFDFERFVHTWSLVHDCGGTALEIGANPYFTTVLLREFTDLDLTLTNSFDPDYVGPAAQTVSYVDPLSDSASEHVFDYTSLNVERAPFPFADNSFDLVIFCEVIEHLLMDPCKALLEIKRVLKPGGRLVVSTPNVARLENVARLASGANMYDPYSGYGPYGRHNREFTRHELVKLLEFTGFSVPNHFTVDVHVHHASHFADPTALLPLVGNRLADLGQYIFCVCVNDGTARSGRPNELFRSMADVDLQSW